MLTQARPKYPISKRVILLSAIFTAAVCTVYALVSTAKWDASVVPGITEDDMKHRCVCKYIYIYIYIPKVYHTMINL